MANVDYIPHPITSEGRTTLVVPDGANLESALAPHLNNLLGAIAIIDGSVYARPAWDKVMLRDGQVIQVRAVVGQDGSNPIAIVLSLAVLIAAPYLAGLILPATAGAALTAGVTAAIGAGGVLLTNAIFPPRLPDDVRESERLYTLSGGSNRARPNEPLLLVLGTHRVFPDLASKEYVEFKDSNVPRTSSPQVVSGGENNDDLLDLIEHGLEEPDPSEWYTEETADDPPSPRYNDQFLYQLFDFGIGDLEIDNRRIKETLLTVYEDVTTQAVDDITLVAGNVDTIEGGIFEALNDAITRRTEPNTTKIVFHLLSRYLKTDDSGDVVGQVNRFKLERRLAGSTGAWTSATVVMQTPNGFKARTVSRRSFSYTVVSGQYDVRATLLTTWSTDVGAAGSASLFAVNAHQPSTANFNGRNPLALAIRATGQLSGRIGSLNADVSQRVPVWNGTAWVVGKTSNPAWILRKFWQGFRRPEDSRLMAGRGLSNTIIDDDSLKLWGAFCDAMGLECNLVLDQRATDGEVETLIAQCGWASVSRASGKWGVTWENDDEPLSAIFNPSNIVAGSFEVTYDNQGLADEIVGEFVDRDSEYQQNTLRRTVPGIGTPERPATVPLRGITDGEHAAKEVNRMAAAQFYHTRRMTWEVGPEGGPLFVTRGAVAGLAHDLVGGTVGGRLLSINPSRTNLTATAEVPATGTIWVWDLNGDCISRTYLVTHGVIALNQALPDAPDHVEDDPLSYRFAAFDDSNTDLHKVRITGVEHTVGGVFRLTARDEIPEYYTARVDDLTHALLPTRKRFRPVTPTPDSVTIGTQTWHFGSGEPSISIGMNGDYYLRSDDKSVWRKVGGLWSEFVSLAGADGAPWLTGAGAPDDADGEDGNFYFRTSNATIWRKAAGTWVQLLDIDGINNGAVWHAGEGAPASDLGLIGHWYFRTSNGFIYEKTGAAVWTFRQDVTGAQGQPSTTGTVSLWVWEDGARLTRIFNPLSSGGGIHTEGLLTVMNTNDHMVDESTGALYRRNSFPFLYVSKYIRSSIGPIRPDIYNAPDGAEAVELSTGDEYLRVNGAWVLQASLQPGQSLYCGPTVEAAPSSGLNTNDSFFIDVGSRRGDYYTYTSAGEWVLRHNLFHVRIPEAYASESSVLSRSFDLVETSIYPVSSGTSLFRVGDYLSGSGPVDLDGSTGDVAVASDGEYWIYDGSAWQRAGNLITGERIVIAGITDPEALLSSSSARISEEGDSATLSWSMGRVESATITANPTTTDFPHVIDASDIVSGSLDVSPTETTVYTLTAVGKDGSTITRTTTVTYALDPIIDSFSSNPISITAGGSATLSWTTSHATSVSITNISNAAVDGSATVSPTVTTIYTLTATGAAGSTPATMEVTISVVPAGNPPTITSFTADDSPITSAQTTTLRWVTSGATSLSINEGIGTVTGSSGSVETSPTSITRTYTLTAVNSSGSDSSTVRVEVCATVEIASFTADDSSIVEGGSTILRWSLSGAANATLSISGGVGAIGSAGSISVSPSTTTTYTLTATDPCGSETAQVTVTVTPSTPAEDPQTLTFSASNISSPSVGDSITLQWTTQDCDDVIIRVQKNSPAGSIEFANFAASPNGSTTYTFPSAGNYSFTCQGRNFDLSILANELSVGNYAVSP